MFLRNRIIFNLCKNSITNYKNVSQVALISSSGTSHNFNVAVKKVNKSKEIKSVNKFVKRTHTCGELTANDVGEKVKLYGWLQHNRMGKFLILRDAYGLTQCIIPQERNDLWESIKNLTYESVINISGTVVLRPEDKQNKQMLTGDVEVLIDTLEVSNASVEKLPFNIKNFLKPTEQTGMKHRYLFLRFPEMQANLRLASWVLGKMSNYLRNECDFVEVKTPTLFRRTPGGAREFVVPTKFENKFYALTQSPQQLKQLLMIGGIDRYFQVATCYRDETSRNDRQPEFTQMDIELSFVDSEGVMELMEDLIKHSWPDHLGELNIPFPRITYEEVMEKYGSEKPDLTIPYNIENVTEILKLSSNLDKLSLECNDSFQSYAIVFPGKQKYLTKSVQKKLLDINKRNFKNSKLIQLRQSNNSIFKKMDDLFSKSISETIKEKLELKEDDVLFITYGEMRDSQGLIGKLRVEFTNCMESENHFIRSKDFQFIWVYDFPLFERKENQDLVSAHHPFTRPHSDDMHYLFTDPMKVRGLHYDLVLNGSEIAGGSIRIHEHDLQEKVLRLLNIEPSTLDYFLNAFKFGAPPHGGIAIGFDRYVSILCRAQSIRDVIAFPKTIDGNDLMTGAPSSIPDEERIFYNLKSNVKN